MSTTRPGARSICVGTYYIGLRLYAAVLGGLDRLSGNMRQRGMQAKTEDGKGSRGRSYAGYMQYTPLYL